MKKISWCKKQVRGMKLIDSNDNLSKEYYQNAEESLRVLRNIKETKSNMWLATTKYYIEYFAVYSILMKIGIKCEIHDCTISVVKFLESEGIIEKGISKVLDKDKDIRIDNQYYLKNKSVEINFNKISAFLISIKKSLIKLDSNIIKEIREKLNRI